MEIKLKDKIKEKIDEYDTISNLIFTTYSLDIPFFETKLLPYLFDIEIHKGIRNQEFFIVEALTNKLHEKNTKINVFCDNYLGDYEKIGNYQIKQVKANGVFHPKLIIIIGKKKKKDILTLLVSSANLTTSSYGINKEVLGILTIDKKNIIEEIIKNSNDIWQIIENLANNGKLNDKLILTGLNDEKNFLDKINNNNLKIVTPFITNDMLTNEKFKDAEILLTSKSGFSDGNKYDSSLKKLFVLNNDKEFIHAKVYIMDDKVIVGSHNFTNKAINNKNVEASLIIKDTKTIENFKNWFKELYKNKTEYEYQENVETEDEDKDSSTIKIEDAILDYNTNEVTITLEKNYQNVKLLTYELTLTKNESNKFSCNLNDDIFNQILLNRFFCLEIDNKYKAYGTFYIKNLPDNFNILTITANYFDFLEFVKTNKHKLRLETYEEKETDSKKSYEKDKYDIANIYVTYNKITENLKKEENKPLTIYDRKFDNFTDSFVSEYKNNFEDKNLLYFLLTAKEIEIILNKYIIKYDEFNKVFEELKKEAISKLKDEFKLKEKKAKELLDIYLDNLEVDYENNKRE